MPWVTITKPAVGEALRKTSDTDAIVDDLNYLYGVVGGGTALDSLANGSFEIDSDADDTTLDGWAKVTYTGGTVARSSTSAHHGRYAAKFIHPGGGGNGGGYITADAFQMVNAGKAYGFDGWITASAAGMSNHVKVIFYNAAKDTIISTVTLYDPGVASPTSWTEIRGACIVPTGAYWARLKVTGGDSAVTTGGTAYFDGLRSGELWAPAIVSVAASDSTPAARAAATYLCDGTDDATEINLAITATTTLGGVVLLYAGNYSLSPSAPITMKSNVVLMGEGDGTALNASGTWAGSSHITTGAALSNAKIKDLKIAKSSATGLSGCTGIYFQHALTDVSVENVTLDSLTGTASIGIMLTADYTRLAIRGNRFVSCDRGFEDYGSAGTRVDLLVEANEARSCADYGLAVLFGSGTGHSRAIFRGNLVNTCGQGIYIAGALSDLEILANTVIASTNIGIEGGTGSRVIISENIVRDCGTHGIQAESADGIIKGNFSYGNSQTTDDTSDGIKSTGTKTMIYGNTVRHGGGAKKHKYGINNTGNYAQISGNSLTESCKTSGNELSNGGTGAEYGGQYSASDAQSTGTTSASYVTVKTMNFSCSVGKYTVFYQFKLYNAVAGVRTYGRLQHAATTVIALADRTEGATTEHFLTSGVWELDVTTEGTQAFTFEASTNANGTAYISDARIKIERRF